jgi:hypothetical protein
MDLSHQSHFEFQHLREYPLSIPEGLSSKGDRHCKSIWGYRVNFLCRPSVRFRSVGASCLRQSKGYLWIYISWSQLPKWLDRSQSGRASCSLIIYSEKLKSFQLVQLLLEDYYFNYLNLAVLSLCFKVLNRYEHTLEHEIFLESLTLVPRWLKWYSDETFFYSYYTTILSRCQT